ncbi:tyrosine-type recombinase/integrase [Gemmatirosa kalamazoonensis]|uniref:tyrosine-type recombinase/integrase n=1 Tax=Gemmatirosa kalamazoonensis TaxID=861299 RepID=UPI00046D1C8B|nr:tyrosine-type recombinase/integrase [Gemmatirosa kalamazoonensis]
MPARKSRNPARAQGAGPADAPERPEPSPENAALIEQFLVQRELRPNTRSAYLADLRTFAAALGPQSLLDVRPDDVRAWLHAHTRDPSRGGSTVGWSPRTAARKLASLKAFYRWCRETPRDDDAARPKVAFSPVAQLRTPQFIRPDPVRLAREALRTLFDWWEARIAECEADGTAEAKRERDLHVLDVAIFRLCYHLGLRVSSAQGIQLRELDMADPHRWIVTVYVKGNKPRRKIVAGVVRADVQRWLDVRLGLTPRAPVRRRKTNAVSPLGRPLGDPDAYLFLHPWTGRVLSRKRAWERLLLAAREAGLSPAVVRQLSPHKLRHAIAYHALADGHSITDVQGLLDHEDVRTTTVYVEASEAQRFETMEQLSRDNVLRR